MELVAEAGGRWLRHARFAHMLKRMIVERLSQSHPPLGEKVKRLSLAQFAELSREVSRNAQRKNGGG
jgi:hypothetical protein